MSKPIIRPVRTRRDYERFFDVAHRLQGHDPYWIAPLRLLERHRLDPKRNPWFRHGEAAFWLAERDGVPVGRISAQVDRSHLELRADGTGFFGFFECEDDPQTAGALFDTATGWLEGQGMQRCRGPFSLNINEESGLLVDGFRTPPRMMMGHAQPYYRRLVEGAGFAQRMDLHAFITPMDCGLPYKQLRWLERELERNRSLSLRPLDPRRLTEDVRTMVGLFNAAWADNWGFIPLTEADIAHMVRELKPLLIPELVAFAMVDGQPKAMCVALPDFNELIRGLDGRLWPTGWAKLAWRILNRHQYVSGTRVPFMGVAPEYRNKPMGSVLAVLTVGAVREASLRLRMPVCEMSWVLEDNSQTRHSIEDIGGRRYKTYRIYDKPIGP